MTIADRWSVKAQQHEVVNIQSRLNTLGGDGWEMISSESIPMCGSFSKNLKGYANLVFFKGQID